MRRGELGARRKSGGGEPNSPLSYRLSLAGACAAANHTTGTTVTEMLFVASRPRWLASSGSTVAHSAKRDRYPEVAASALPDRDRCGRPPK